MNKNSTLQKNGTLLYRIFLSICYIVSAGSFFFRYLKIEPFDNFKASDSDIIKDYFLGITSEKLNSASIFESFEFAKDIIETLENFDISGLIFRIILYFPVPIILALISAVLIIVIKKKSKAGLVTGVLGLIGAALNILLRFSLSNTIISAFNMSIHIDKLIKTTLATNINLAFFAIAALCSFALFFAFVKSDNAENNLIMNNNYASFNTGYNADNAENGSENFENEPVGNYIDDDEPTSRVSDSLLLDYTVKQNKNKENSDYKNETACGTMICEEGTYKGASFQIPLKDEVIIGRDPSQSHIVIDSKYKFVSKKHCGVKYEDNGRYKIKVYSSNGIFVNKKERIAQGEELILTSGTIISVGNKENSFLLK